MNNPGGRGAGKTITFMTDRERIDDLAKRVEGLEQRILGSTPRLVIDKHYDWNSPSPYDLSATSPKKRKR